MELQKRNDKFTLLSAIGALLVISGHFGSTALNFGGLYQYDTFHMPMFAFISGYFYKSQNHETLRSCGKYIWRKFRRLLIPYFCWNLAYGIFANLLPLIRPAFTIGQGRPLNFEHLFLIPFQVANGYEFNIAAWWIPALFLVETANAVLHCGLKKLRVPEKAGGHSDFGNGVFGCSANVYRKAGRICPNGCPRDVFASVAESRIPVPQ